MCGRYTLTDLEALVRDNRFQLERFPSDLSPRYNIAPSQQVPAIINQAPRELQLVRWGLIPSWAKDPTIGYRMINARAETLAEKPAFRRPLQRQRCLIPADGFFEWQRLGSQSNGSERMFPLWRDSARVVCNVGGCGSLPQRLMHEPLLPQEATARQ